MFQKLQKIDQEIFDSILLEGLKFTLNCHWENKDENKVQQGTTGIFLSEQDLYIPGWRKKRKKIVKIQHFFRLINDILVKTNSCYTWDF